LSSSTKRWISERISRWLLVLGLDSSSFNTTAYLSTGIMQFLNKCPLSSFKGPEHVTTPTPNLTTTPVDYKGFSLLASFVKIYSSN